jgi:hypothetical protein
MPYELTTIPFDNYLHVKVRGQNNTTTVNGYLLDVARLCRKHNYSAVLIEEHLSGPSLSMADIFNVIRNRSSDAWFLSHIAYVDTNTDHDFGQMKFAEMVALNEGVQVRMFQDLNAAHQWLEQPLKS